jgi:hypothetical protein
MLHKKPEQITRWLGGPGNMTLDTISDLIFATSGQFFKVVCVDDLSKGKSNRCMSDWWKTKYDQGWSATSKPATWSLTTINPAKSVGSAAHVILEPRASKKYERVTSQ